MAALAEHWCAHRQHAGMIRAVRLVTRAAILRDRGVLPEIRPTLFSVAVEASLVERLLRELPLARVTVCTVAVAAAHLALADRMRIRFQHRGTLLLVTIEADLRLRRGQIEQSNRQSDG